MSEAYEIKTYFKTVTVIQSASEGPLVQYIKDKNPTVIIYYLSHILKSALQQIWIKRRVKF